MNSSLAAETRLGDNAREELPLFGNGSTRLNILSLSKERGEGRFHDDYVNSI